MGPSEHVKRIQTRGPLYYFAAIAAQEVQSSLDPSVRPALLYDLFGSMGWVSRFGPKFGFLGWVRLVPKVLVDRLGPMIGSQG